MQLFLHGGSFGTTDAEFGHDVGFYVFDLPFYRLLLTLLFVAVFVALLLSAGTHYLFGGIRLTVSTIPKRPKDARRILAISRPASTQIALLAGTFIAFKAVAYWFDPYQLLWSERKAPTFDGAGYTDINAVLQAHDGTVTLYQVDTADPALTA